MQLPLYNIYKSFEDHSGQLNSPEKNDVPKSCMCLNYWLNDKTKLINHPCKNINNLYSLLGMHISKNSLTKECPNISDFVVYQNKFKTKKELYFHTENLHWITNKFSSVHVEDKFIYSKYLGECCRFYKLINFRDIFKESRTFLLDKDISISVDEINAFNNPVCPSENGDVRASLGSAGYMAP
ncbi:PIR Superfamily Protein [Plasmodium ovale curtisi]|uniref:PIR Superfamily Protein n=1 Tax=Plasmodium ovale curtisi TaxID=864141 RepID=A0A1A8XD38_PLAOA|nr:PIR Superfamily Protein [Plasmodium ovale curtisi]SBT02224.1 PIR Superfamily Protein [Plasmodium ovale curtisi]